jgi:hypothetical protein
MELKLLFILLLPFSLSAQINMGVGASFTQNKPAGTFTAGYTYKRFTVEYAQFVNKKEPVYSPRIGYTIGNFTPYISYAGGGMKAQYNNIIADVGMQGKLPYASISYNSSVKAWGKQNNEFLVCALSFISGLANGSREAMQHHWAAVEESYPNLNAQYWNPAISWENKNKSWITKAIPTFTDGYHLLQFVERGTLVLAVVISINEKPNFIKILKKAVKVYAANRVGHYITYNLIFKDK